VYQPHATEGRRRRLGDGRVVDEMESPTADGMLDKMKSLGG
jgi:hypothetical protein